MNTLFAFLVSIVLLVPLIVVKIFIHQVIILLISGLGLYLFNILWLKPQTLRWKLQRQGIKGPPPAALFYGNNNTREMQNIKVATSSSMAASKYTQLVAHDYTSTLFPYLEQWRKEYGTLYTYSTGGKQHLYVNNAEMVKEMNQSQTLNLGKPSYVTNRLAPMLGNGILRSNGHIWSQQRKIVAPEFFMDKVKGMVGVMVQSVNQLIINKWDENIGTTQGGVMAEICVDEDLRGVSADIISRACFGSSYLKGKNIFSKLRTLQKLTSTQSVLFGDTAFRIFRSRKQKEARNLEKEIEQLIWETVEKRKQECLGVTSVESEKDLLQLILEGAISDVGKKDSCRKFIVDNCKNIYFAGHESTAVAASWCIMLLALHPEWQHRIREEVAQVCPTAALDSSSLSKLKTVTMVILEVLRLYPPAAFVSREALEDSKIGNIVVPKGVCIWTLIPTLHRDQDIWGSEVNEFNPERFANGVSSACKLPQVFIPFGLGPRLCLGRHFALVQLKVVLSLIVSKFSFSLSSKYNHSPTYRMIVEPGEGVHIIVRKTKSSYGSLEEG